MEDFRKIYAEELKRLNVEDDEEVTAKMLNSKFKKKALRVHPDKTGDANDEEFKNLLKDFNTCMEALGLIVKEEEEKENNDMAEFFAKNNVSKENMNSYTVLLENEKTKEWNEVLKKMKLEKDPMKLVNGGTQFKTDVLGHVVSVSFYGNPSNGQSKLLIQGSMFHIRMFIVDKLPPLYIKVCAKAKKKETKEVQPKIPIAMHWFESNKRKRGYF